MKPQWHFNCLTVVVADPRIASGAAGSLNEIKLLNLFCKLLDAGAVAFPRNERARAGRGGGHAVKPRQDGHFLTSCVNI